MNDFLFSIFHIVNDLQPTNCQKYLTSRHKTPQYVKKGTIPDAQVFRFDVNEGQRARERIKQLHNVRYSREEKREGNEQLAALCQYSSAEFEKS